VGLIVPIGSLFTLNLTPNSVWVTIYDLAKTQHLDYGWMQAAYASNLPPLLGPNPADPYSARQWTSGNYVAPGVYYARGEVKDNNNNTIFDTEIEMTPELLYATYLTGDGNGNYWWVLGFPPNAVAN
jgi:hypothetical protein